LGEICHFFIKAYSFEEVLGEVHRKKVPHANRLSDRLETVIETEREKRQRTK